jgi:uncharacterized protein
MERQPGGIETRIKSDTVTALKAGEKDLVGALRLLTSALKKARIDAGADPTEADELAVLGRERKRRLESLAIYEEAGRDDLAAKERFEEGVIAAYLPEELSADELSVLVDEAIVATGASTAKDMGKVMGIVMKQVAGRADGTAVNQMVRAKLAG